MNLWREVTHLWYLGWPDQGVPSEANSLIAFLIEARSQMKIQNGANTTSPAVVHCSPGNYKFFKNNFWSVARDIPSLVKAPK